MRTDQAKRISLFDLLAHLGHHPKSTHKAGNDVWYISPFRQENTPSFKISLRDNAWYDHGEGQGGNILDFVMSYRRTDLRGALAFLDQTGLKSRFGNLSLFPAENNSSANAPGLFDRPVKKEVFPEVLEVKPVYSYALKNYLADRGIAADVAYKHLKEIRYKVEDNTFYALGFLNRKGGWELRSSIFKGGIGEKDISVIESGSNQIHCYEGFMDFLSAETIRRSTQPLGDVLVLNSVALKKVGVDYIRSKQYAEVHTYFDNDLAGNNMLKFIQAELPEMKVTSHNYLYQGYNDLNDLLVKKRAGNQNIKQ